MFTTGGTFGHAVEQLCLVGGTEQALATDLAGKLVGGQSADRLQAFVTNRNSGDADEWGVAEPAVAGEQGRKDAFSCGSKQNGKSVLWNSLLRGPG